MRIIILTLVLLFTAPLYAQHLCGSTLYNSRNTATQMRIHAPFVKITDALSGIDQGTVSKVIQIPVVVHLLYQTETENISTAQIESGIAALNRDFRRRNSDTANTPERFKKLAADVEIEFVLATADPSGRATTGIVRKPTTIKEWTSDDKIKFSKNGGDGVWDASSYLNIWVGNIRRTLGYATAPGGDAAKDGIVISTIAFGTIGKSGAYNMGRTLVHETGHWLGLKHIWGDAACGDDGVEDTPRQAGFTSGCPTSFLSSCSNGDAGDMYMNYMDFTNDACMNLFTLGQKAKMRHLFTTGNARSSLLQSKGLQAAWTFDTLITAKSAEAAIQARPAPAITIHPNPATDYLMLDLQNELTGGIVQVISIDGNIVMQQQINSQMQRISVQALQPGLYFIQVKKDAVFLTAKFIKKP